MQINGAVQQRGHVLLVAGDTAGRRRTIQIEPSANLAALSLIPVPVLLGCDLPTDTTYLDGVRDQNALLVKLRRAAATRGPLLVYLSGRLTVDRRSHQLYLALSGTTPSTARYTALPWEWLGIELRQRPASLTTVLLDLAADKGAWPLLQDYGSLPAPSSIEVYGTVAPPGFPGPDSSHVSAYTRAWIEQLRSNPQRPTSSRLHAMAVSAAALPPGTLVVPAAPELTAVPGLEQEQNARPLSTVQRVASGDTAFISELRERSAQKPATREAPPRAPAPDRPAVRPDDHQYPRHASSVPLPRAEPVRPAHPAPKQAAVQTPIPVQHPGPDAHSNPVPQQQDPRPYVYALAREGRFTDATLLAQAWETHTLQTLGIDSPHATQWIEIRADLAKQAGNYVLATQLWISAGRTRLAHQSPDAPEVLTTAQSAHYCWTQITDTSKARECGPELVALLRALPSLDRRHLSVAQQRMEHLHNTPTRR
ncbi:hypothetical protein [Streptomyces microflavus]|uniref:hypothetical protein n=1 Tax=Streptomyces microflavus TaxID=1919 RepID=UPI00386338B2|nr:hypothetical protein OH770_00605 [Streptomyces microflavus]